MTEITKSERAEYLERVKRLQNHPAHQDRNVLDFCGFFDRHAEFTHHIASLQMAADRWEREHGMMCRECGGPVEQENYTPSCVDCGLIQSH